MTTLVLCVDRGASFGSTSPVVGEAAVSELITRAGIDDPEDSRVNCLLETLRVAREVHTDDRDNTLVAVVSGTGESVSIDQDIAEQVDTLIEEYDPDSAIVVVDSAEDERAVPIIESRLRVDAVDRVIVQQARDIESVYYLLKQLLVDEELRSTVLVPLGAILLTVPIIVTLTQSVTAAIAVVTAVIGAFFLYKGLDINGVLTESLSSTWETIYSGRLSLVTSVVGLGLALTGLFAGAIAVSDTTPGVMMAVGFVFESIPWLALSAFAISIGRLFDAVLNEEEIHSGLRTLPFAVLAAGLFIRGITAYLLENAGLLGSLVLLSEVAISGDLRLALFVGSGLLVSLLGVIVARLFPR